MHLKFWHRFYFKVFLVFWFFVATILISASLVAGNLTLKNWISPREKMFINSYASILINSLNVVNGKKKYICAMDKSFNNTFSIISQKELYSCSDKNFDFTIIRKNNFNKAYLIKNRLISDAVTINGEKFWLVAKRNPSLFTTFDNNHVKYRLFFALVFSALICFFLAKYLTLPLKIIKEKMYHFSKGNLDSRVGDAIKNRRDEFTEIGHDFDCMATNIQQLVKSKQTMLYNISHELRSPLARQLMTIDVLKISEADKHQLLLQKIEKENHQLNDLITEILMLAKLNTKTFSFNPSETELTQLIKNSIKNIEFEFGKDLIQYKSPKHTVALIDSKLIAIVIENLLKNAVKYSGCEDKIIVTLNATLEAIKITVADKGQGISETDLPYIFEPFKQSSNQTESMDKGYGLGLAIAKEIIDLHSGSINAHNNESGGLTVTINLPVTEKK